MSVLSRRSPKPLNLVSFGDDGRAVIDVPVAGGGGGDGSSSAAISASAAANHAALREAASLGGVDPDD